jgi:hypothetical protein
MKASARAQREERDAQILRSLAAGATLREAGAAHGVSKSTVHRVLENAQATLPEARYARDLMIARFQEYRQHLAPVLAKDPIKAVPRLLEVDVTEAKMRGLFEPERRDGTAEAQGMLASFVAGLREQRGQEGGHQ